MATVAVVKDLNVVSLANLFHATVETKLAKDLRALLETVHVGKATPTHIESRSLNYREISGLMDVLNNEIAKL